METGNLTERITIFTPAQDCKLTSLDDFEEFKTVWASVREVTTREQMRSHIEIQSGQITVQIRYLSGLSDDSLIRWRNRYYSITNLSADRRKGEILLGCSLSGLNENTRVTT